MLITVEGAQQLDSHSDAYTTLIDDFKSKLGDIMEERVVARYEKLLNDRKVDITEEEVVLLQEKEKINQELADTALEIKRVEQEIINKGQDL